ncbi:hypothetical protein Q1695_009003 [Nippostrongylus brasiliensis]|nr:hypothetical protein Q1695_009003 [Nippostrongylus brasiliensis]
MFTKQQEHILAREMSSQALLHLLEFLVDGRYEPIIMKLQSYITLKRMLRRNKSAILRDAMSGFAEIVEELTEECDGVKEYFREKERYLKDIIESVCLEFPQCR